MSLCLKLRGDQITMSPPAAEVRLSIGSLRTLVAVPYPPSFRSSGLIVIRPSTSSSNIVLMISVVHKVKQRAADAVLR